MKYSKEENVYEKERIKKLCEARSCIWYLDSSLDPSFDIRFDLRGKF